MKNGHGNIVTVWTATTRQALALPEAARCLCDEEIAQAVRLKQTSGRNRFLAARALLRHALSKTVRGAIKSEQWRFRIGRYGKPMMAPDLPQLEFNLSHAGDCVAVGVGNAGPVGIDIETAEPDDCAQMVHDALTSRERGILRQMPDDRKAAAFIQFWTVKEACAKALGLGVTLDFRDLEVALNPPRILNPRGLLDTGDTFAVESSLIFMDRNAYRLSIAQVTPAAPEASFCFKSLTCNSAAQMVGTPYERLREAI